MVKKAGVEKLGISQISMKELFSKLIVFDHFDGFALALKGLKSLSIFTKKLNHIILDRVLNSPFPAGNYMFKVNNRNTRTRCEICSQLTVKTPERRHWCRFVVFIVICEHILHLAYFTRRIQALIL